MKMTMIAVILILSGKSFAQSMQEKALGFVPEGKIVQEKSREFKVQTKSGSLVEVEFEASGDFEEASGKTFAQDVFNPQDNMISLSKAVETLRNSHKNPTGEWNLEKTFIRGWVYEFEGVESGREVDYVVDASTGKLLDTRFDD